MSNKLWRLNGYFEGNNSYYCCWYVDYIVYFTCYVSFNSLWLIWVLFPWKRLCIQLPKGKLVIYFELETYFNDHQTHCQYKLHNLKNVHKCRNAVNSLNFVLRLHMHESGKIHGGKNCFLIFSLLKSTAGTCGLNCNGWYVITEIKTQQRHFCMIALLITLCKMIQCSVKVENFSLSSH